MLKALCLGAKGVMVGRPMMYGLGIASNYYVAPCTTGKSPADPTLGTDCVREVLRGLLANLDRSIGLSGIKSHEDCNRSFPQPDEMP